MHKGLNSMSSEACMCMTIQSAANNGVFLFLWRIQVENMYLKTNNKGWRDGSVVKSTDCSSRGSEFNSQQPHGGSQSSVMGSDALFWYV